ncbi:DUF2057 family protein [Photobacterium leiognathi]|uniref:DUF2057 family protein n=1 Tax=Photobacterium leiognathi TaxID=553611 RepID=UPI00076A4834|nr:DUF2057 family protein [Photobacterium leiognathi]
MKKFVILSSLLAAGFTLPVVADVKVELSPDLTLLAVNGSEDFGEKWYSNTREVNLNDGDNQILVRVEKLIPQAGDWAKFNSKPMVVSFNASNEIVKLSPAFKIDGIQAQKAFEKAPKLDLRTKSSQNVNFNFAVLPGSYSILTGYEKALAAFNSKQGDTKYLLASPVSPSIVANEATIQSSNQKVILSSVQSDFLSLSNAERKRFLQWAIIQ